jgi:hypothetical protein
MKILDPADTTVGHLVSLRHNFMASIDLEKAYDQSYRGSCSRVYIYLPEDELFFKNVVDALMDRLPNRRHTILEIGAFGVGKSLLDIVRGDLFATPSNHVVLDKLPQTHWKEQIEALTSQSGYLVIYIAGAHPEVRSNLERALVKALQKALPDGIHLGSEFERAQTWLEGLRPGGSRSHLRPLLEQQLSQSSSTGQSWTIGQLEQGLQQREQTALNAFHNAFAAAIDWPVDSFGPTTAEGVYDEMLRTYVGSGRPFSGILIFFDEFAQWARTASPGDISTLQTFVEWVNRSRRVAMVMSSQVRPQHQGSGYNELETLISRTYEEPFKRTSYAALLCGALERRTKVYAPVDTSPDWSHLAALHQRLFPEDEAPDQHVHCYYPFHPVTVKALTVLTDQLGYHERSVTQYLSSGDDESGFGEFLQGPLFEDDRATLRLVTLDRLFPYFVPRLREDRQPIYSRYEHAIANTTGELNVRLIEALALCDVLEAAVPIPSTEEGLALILNLPADSESRAEVSQRLQNLADAELISTDGQGRYKLVASGSLSLPSVRRAINQRKQQMLSSNSAPGSIEAIRFIKDSTKFSADLRRHNFSLPPVENLPFSGDMQGNNRQIESAEYAKRFKISHSFEVELVTRQQLLVRAHQVRMNSAFARYETILVVIATDVDTQQQELDTARQVACELARTGVSVGVPKRPFALSDAILNVLAADQVIQQEAYRGAPVGELAKRQYQSQLLQATASEVNPEAFEWYTPDLDPQDQPLLINSLLKVADRAALYLGSACPNEIAQTNLVGDHKVQTKWDLVDDLLRADSIQISRRNGKQKKGSILRGALAPIGLISIRTGMVMSQFDTAHVVEPDLKSHPRMRAIWDLLDAAIGKGGDGTTIARIINELSRMPYWLPRDLAMYILSAFIGFRDLQVYSNRSNTLIVRDADALRKVWDDPTNYSLRLAYRVPLLADVRTFLQDLLVVIRATIPTNTPWQDINNANYLTEEQVKAVASALRIWDIEIGRKVRECAKRFNLNLPSPAKEWLGFLADIAEAKLNRSAGETYTVTLPERLTNNQVSLSSITSQLDHQMRQLHELVKDMDMIDRADSARQGTTERSPLAVAWGAFCAQPLNDTIRRDLRKALTALTVETRPHTMREQQLAGEESVVVSYPLEPTRKEDSEQSNDWKTIADSIAHRPFGAEALRRCVNVLQIMAEQQETDRKALFGEAILTHIVTALIEQGEQA